MSQIDAQAAGAPRPMVEAEFSTGPVASIAGAHALHDTYTAFLAPLLPEFINLFGLSNTQAGLLSVFMQGPSLLQPVIGHLADRVNLRWIVFMAPAVTTALMSWLTVAPSYGIVAALLLLVGVSSAGLHAVAPVVAGRLSGARLGRGMSFWMVGGELGRTLGPLVVVGAIALLGLRGMPWLTIVGLAGSVVIFGLLREVAARPERGDGSEPLPWRQALAQMRGVMLPLVGIITLRAFVTVAVTTYLPTFLTQEGAALWFAGISLSILEAAGVVGALLGGSLSDQLGRRLVLTISMVASPLLLLAFLGVQGWARLPFLLLMGFTLLATTPVIMALVQESFYENRSLANGLYMALNFVIRSLVVVAVGGMGDLFGLRTSYVVSAILMLVGVPILRWLPGERPATDAPSV